MDLNVSRLNVWPCVASFLIKVFIISIDILDKPLVSSDKDKFWCL